MKKKIDNIQIYNEIQKDLIDIQDYEYWIDTKSLNKTICDEDITLVLSEPSAALPNNPRQILDYNVEYEVYWARDFDHNPIVQSYRIIGIKGYTFEEDKSFAFLTPAIVQQIKDRLDEHIYDYKEGSFLDSLISDELEGELYFQA